MRWDDSEGSGVNSDTMKRFLPRFLISSIDVLQYFAYACPKSFSWKASLMKPLQPITRLIVNHFAQKNLFLKNKLSAQDLAHTHALIIDTPGTITRNEVIVSHLYADNKQIIISGKGYYTQGTLFSQGEKISVSPESDLYRLAQGLQLLSSHTNTTIDIRGAFHVHGNSIHAALHVLAAKMGITQKDTSAFTKIEEKKIDAYYHAALYEYQKKGILFIVGTPEFILSRSKSTSLLEQAIQEFQNNGLQSVLVAYKQCDLTDDLEKIIDKELVVLGVCGIEDAIRSDAMPAISKARKAGFHIVMITHDHQRTAISIAKQVGIYKEGDEAVDGCEFSTISDQLLHEQLMYTTVYSGITPQQKLRIVDALRARSFSLLMSTEFNDSFANIIRSIEDSRHILSALERIMVYCFSSYVSQLLIILGIGFVSLLYPALRCGSLITIKQFLWINVGAIGFFVWALTLEKKEPKILFDERWHHKGSQDLLNKPLVIQMFLSAIIMALGTAAVFLLFAPYSLELAYSMGLAVFSLYINANAWNCRSIRFSLFKIGFLSNKWLLFGPLFISFCVSLLLPITLNPYQWGFSLLVASSLVVLEQCRRVAQARVH